MSIERERSHSEEAQARVLEIRAIRERIPNFVIPSGHGRHMNVAASVPEAFIEQAVVAVVNNPALVSGSPDPARVRDLMSYAAAYVPVAVELEALARFIRHSAAMARYRAGTEALAVYAIAQRLAKQPETADLAPVVAEMRRTLGKTRRKAKPDDEAEPKEPAATEPAD